MGKNIFSFDCETNGLYGFAFAVGAVVLDKNGKTLDSFTCITETEKVTDEWVLKNILSDLLTYNDLRKCISQLRMRNLFWDFWMIHRETSICISDFGSPVESGFFRQCIMDNPKRIFLGPYPLHEVETLLISKGVESDTDRIKFSGLVDMRKHHPLDDAYVSAICWLKAMNMTNVPSLKVVFSKDIPHL